MDEIIQIKCPFCGAVLSVKNQPGIEGKNVTCPICKRKYPFSQFKRIEPAKAKDTGAEESTSYAYGDPAGSDSGADPINLTLGNIKILGGDASYQLKPGRNIIGRKAQKSMADFQIDTGENRAMSREHIVIEVKKIPGKGFVHYISLYKEKVNDTLVGNEPLVYGDCIILAHGDVVKLPGATLRFEIPDGEATEF